MLVMISPNGAKPSISRRELSPKLMKNCVVREEASVPFAKVTRPRVLMRIGRSDGIVASCYAFAIVGSPWIPTWAMKRGTTRKKRFWS